MKGARPYRTGSNGACVVLTLRRARLAGGQPQLRIAANRDVNLGTEVWRSPPILHVTRRVRSHSTPRGRTL